MTAEERMKATLGELLFGNITLAADLEKVTKERDDALAQLQQAMRELTELKGSADGN